MQVSKDQSKFLAPRTPGRFYRQRLLERLDQHEPARIVLLVGQAGQGKSTLAACYARLTGRPKAWINIDPADEDPISFMLALIGAVKAGNSGTDFNRLESNLAAYTKAARKDNLFSAWARLFWQIAPPNGLIVLDGLERISFESPTFQLIQEIVRWAPPKSKFLMASRKRPPLKLQKMKIANQALVIDNRQLAFRESETRAFLESAYNLTLEDNILKQIQSVTEGWISGVIIFAQWLARSQSRAGRELFQSKLEWTVVQELYAFFSEEVFQSIDRQMQDFLIKTAFLETLEPACIDAVLGTDDAAVVLARLSAETFFIQQYVSEEGENLYRYHQLFRRYLLHKHANELDRHLQGRLLLIAADYYLRTGRPETSLPFYIQAGQFDRAEQAISLVGMQMVRHGQLARLKAYLEKIPEDERGRLPWLLLYHSVAVRSQDGRLAMRQLCRCLDLFSLADDYNGRILALSFLIETALLLGYSLIPIDELINGSLELLDDPPEHVPPIVQAQLWLQLGYATIRGVGDFATGLEAARTAYLMGHRQGYTEICAYALALQKLVEIYLGHFRQAAETDAQLVALLPECSEELRTFHLSTDCVMHIYTGEGEEALADLERFEKRIEEYGFYHFHTWLMIYRCLLYPRIGRASEAEAILRAWLRTCQEGSFSRAMALLFLGFCAYYRAGVKDGLECLEEAARIFSKGPLRSEFQYHAAVKALGIAAYLQADYRKAQPLLEQALEYARHIGSDALLADVYLFMGLNSYAAGRRAAAGISLRAGFEIARRQGYTHFVVIHEDDLACACLLALRLEAVKDPRWIIRLLVASGNLAVEKELARLTATEPENRQLAMAWRAIRRSRLPRLTVFTLGRFTVELDGRPIPPSGWKGRSNARFFKMLCAYGGRRVSRERLAEALWPNANPKASESNFKSGLHRLRQVFATREDDRAGFEYIVLRQSQVGLDPGLCWLDSEAFRKAASSALESESYNDAIQFGRRALELYGGDFLPEDISPDRVREARRELKKLYLRLLEHLAKLCLLDGKLQTASRYLQKWLEADPYSNTACRRLMRVYTDMGQRKKALTLYRDFAARHRADLELEPDETTRALYRELSN